MTIEEGYMPFMGFQTYYRIARAPGDKPPLLLLHGGPGSTHNYMELFDCLAEQGRTVVAYDQIGCGRSYLDGHSEFWKMETWIEELKELRSHLGLDRCHILGQSWGGMLLLQYLIGCRPRGVLSAVLSSTLPSSQLWGREQHRVLRYFSAQEQQAIRLAEETGDYGTAACQAATAHFMEMRCAGAPGPDAPECLRRPKKTGDEAYLTAWGNNEYTPSGTLKDFDLTDRLGEITIPVLITSGTDDLCTPLTAKIMHDGIPDSSWYLFEGARHMPFVENQDQYMQLMKTWMQACESGQAGRDFIKNK